MNTAELKSDLHRLIVETNDINILNSIRQYIIQLQKDDIDWWDVITEQQKDSIQTGLDQLEAGNRIAHQQIRQNVVNLFKKHD